MSVETEANGHFNRRDHGSAAHCGRPEYGFADGLYCGLDEARIGRGLEHADRAGPAVAKDLDIEQDEPLFSESPRARRVPRCWHADDLGGDGCGRLSRRRLGGAGWNLNMLRRPGRQTSRLRLQVLYATRFGRRRTGRFRRGRCRHCSRTGRGAMSVGRCGRRRVVRMKIRKFRQRSRRFCGLGGDLCRFHRVGRTRFVVRWRLQPARFFRLVFGRRYGCGGRMSGCGLRRLLRRAHRARLRGNKHHADGPQRPGVNLAIGRRVVANRCQGDGGDDRCRGRMKDDRNGQARCEPPVSNLRNSQGVAARCAHD